MKIGVIGISNGWSSQQLAEAVRVRTGQCPLIDLGEVRLDLDRDELVYHDHNLLDFDALLIKKIGRHYAPDHLDRLDILRYARDRGVQMFSDPTRIARVLNRLSCTVSLRLADIPMPPTVITENPKEAFAAVERFGRAVFKPMFSSKARGMQIIDAGPGAMDEIEEFKESGHAIMYIQKMVALPGRDLGVAFLGGEYLGTYARVGNDSAWNTTVHAGGRYESHEPPDHIIELAKRAQAPFGLDFTCVDVAETDAGPIVFEVSAFGGFRGLLEGCGIDAASKYTDHVLGKIES